MKTAVIYARYSSERQTEQSIEGQLRVCYDYAERNDIVIIDTYIDRAMTGTNDKRTDFQRMLKDSAKKAWDYVLVYKIDRFGRNKYELAMNKHTLKNNGVKLISCMENIPDTPEGIILESLLEGMAEYYSAELSQKVKRGMNETRQKGNFTGGTMIYGYKKDGKKVVIDEDKAEVVKTIYEMYAKNIFVKDIIAYLTEKGILNHGKPFAKNTIHRILQNKKYSGVYYYKDEAFTNIYPQIVPDDLFKLVQNKITKNRYGSRSPFVNYLLHNKITCGYCGRKINGITGTAKSKKVIRYYSCSGRYLKKSCKKKSIRKETLEEIILNALMKVFATSKSIDLFADRIIAMNKKRLQDKSIYNLLLQEKDKLEKSKNNILSAIEQGIVTASTKERLVTLEEQIGKIDEKLLIEKAKDNLKLSKEDIVNHIEKALQNKADKLIDLLVKEIVLYDDKVEIKCNYSTRNKPEELGVDILKEKATIPTTSDTKPGIIEEKEIDVVVQV